MKKWVAVFLSCLVVTACFHQGSKIDGVIWSDQEGYYIYLPGFFINGGFKNLPCTNGCTFIENKSGTYTFTKYTYGVALLESPFFLTAHAFATFSGYDADGRSLPYIWAIMIAAIFYMLAGLRFISKLLSDLNFGKTICWLVPVGIILGTNLFFYTFREAGMSHVYSFFLLASLLYFTHRNQVTPSLRTSILGAISLALLVLIRPTNIVACCIPILWRATNFAEVLRNLKNLFRKPVWLISFSLAFGILIVPQMAYWKLLTGNFIFYSYANEGFGNWAQPKLLQVLFSHQNGWLIYSPIVLMGILGMIIMAIKKHSGWMLPWVLLSAGTYVFASWWAWWFGGAYGHRCFVDFLPILAIPSAYAIKFIQESPKFIRISTGLLFILGVYVNLRMSHMYQGMWDGPDWTWYSYIDKLKTVFYWF
jgi:hypothetical protein